MSHPVRDSPYTDDPNDPYRPEDRDRMIAEAFDELRAVQGAIAAIAERGALRPWDRAFGNDCHNLLKGLYRTTTGEPEIGAPDRTEWLAARTYHLRLVQHFMVVHGACDYVVSGRKHVGLVERFRWMRRRDLRSAMDVL